MRYLFCDILLEQYSYKGQKQKKIFFTLKSCSIIFGKNVILLIIDYNYYVQLSEMNIINKILQ